MFRWNVLSWNLCLAVISLAMSLPAQGADPVAEEPAEFQALDLDHNHALSLVEFLAPVGAELHGAKRDEFYHHDQDGDLQLSVQEFMLPVIVSSR